ncbi:LVIVD repeat-containing protein [Halosolutus halophilus]|uniref:LVIVD repeat-containing protein n=1 Tax=Halosolutus halophilus TaxID=1552990 RepID=UPI0022351DDC|nr:hypothetical protein [Halosolutus halophilus]
MAQRYTRRTTLKALGAAGALGSIDTASADPPERDGLRLFGEQAIDGTTEVVTQQTLAFVATGDGLAIVDLRNPGRPELLVDTEVPGTGVNDVKVDGDLLAISSQAGDQDEDIGTHFYDVSDPTDPEFLGTWVELPAGVHNHYLDGDVAYICREFPFDDSALKIVDASDPTDPTLLSEWRVENDHPELDQPTNFLHDVYVQDDLAYLAYWDAGTRILDVSDPTDPVEVSAMGEAPDADEDVDFPSAEWVQRAFLPPGNSHYVQPTPNGDYVLQGAETFPKDAGVEDPDNDDYGGIKVFDVTDFDDPEMVTRIDPPDVDAFRTSHNFDVTANRLYTSWYAGGVKVFDFTDPSNPEELASYRPEGSSFWTAVRGRGFTIASDIGGGIVFLHDDRGAMRAPGFDGDSVPGRGPGPDGHARPD